MLEILLIKYLDVFSLELADQDHVVFLTKSSFGTELSRHILHHVVMFTINGGNHRIEVLP